MAAPINVYLIGKIGCGKSAVGNTLLRRKVFTSRASSKAVTAQVEKETITVHNRQIHIWDTPGITEVQSQTDEAVGWLKERINGAKSECHVLMWVARYGELCAPEDEYLLKELTKKLPKALLKNHTIVVVTHKDNFESDTEDSGLTFDNWVKQQTGFFKKLCSSVAHKVLPIDNRSKPEGQLNQIFQVLLQKTSSAGGDSYFEIVDHPQEPSSLTIPLPTPGGAIHGRPAMNQTPVAPSIRSTRHQDDTTKKAKRMCGTDVDMKEERRGAIGLYPKAEQGTIDAIMKESSSGGSDSGFKIADHPQEPFSSTRPLPNPRGAIYGRPAMNQTPVAPSIRSTRQHDVTTEMAKLQCRTNVDLKEELPGAIDLDTKAEQGTTDAIMKSNQVDLDIMLLGKTGVGKSRTGNSILDRKMFTSKVAMQSVTIKSQKEITRLDDGRILRVVDTPGVGDTRETTKDEKIFMTAINEAIVSNPMGYHALIIVLRFGSRFTKEDIETMQFLKKVFGENFVKKYCIVVMSHGDHFLNAVKEGDIKGSFTDWCKEQGSEFQTLFQEVEGRVLLFNNMLEDKKEKDKQRNELVVMIYRLMSARCRYTNTQFEKATQELEKQIHQEKISKLALEVQEEISLILHENNRIKEINNLDTSLYEMTGLIKQISSIQTRIDQEKVQSEELLRLCSVVKDAKHHIEQELIILQMKKDLENKKNAEIDQALSEIKEQFEKLRNDNEKLMEKYKKIRDENNRSWFTKLLDSLRSFLFGKSLTSQ